MHKKIIALIVLFGLQSSFIFSQGSNSNLDSIYKTIATSPDTIKIKRLNFIVRAIGANYPDSAIILATRSLGLAKKYSLKKLTAQSCFALGFAYAYKGKYDQCITYFDQALTLYQDLKMKDDVCNMYNSLANIYSQAGNNEQADKNFEKAYELALSEPKSKYYIGVCSFGLALSKGRKKQYKESIELYETALRYFKELGLTFNIPLVLQNISEHYMEIGEFEKAKINNDEAIKYFIQLDDMFGLATAYGTRADLLQKEGKKKEAIEYANKGYNISLKINSFPEMAQKAVSLYSLYKENNDFKNALKFHELLLSYKDSIQTKEQNEAMALAATKFETKQKEAELILKNTELEKSELKVSQRNNLIYFFVGTIVIFVFLLILVYKQFSDKKKANNLLTSQNHEIEKQSALLEEKNKDITDSINYSKFIQQAIIPSTKKVKQILPESFVVFKPKDIVSGDFYLVEEVVGLIYLAVVDCTGHGVPGAMLSVFADSTIKNSISSNHFRDSPAAILSDLCFQFKSNLQTETTANTVNDGVDMAICIIDKKASKISFAGARNGLVLVRNNQIIEFDPSRSGISGSNKGQQLFYEDHFIEVQKGDKFYIYTDGFADQFGGEKGKKFKQKQLHALLVDCHNLPMEEQCKLIEKTFETWKGSLEQIDDVTLIGFQI